MAVKSICDIMRRSNCAGALQYPNARSGQETRTPEELLDLIESKGREVTEALTALRNTLKT